MTKTYELPNEKMIMADVDEKHHTATVSVYALDDLVEAVNKTGHWILTSDDDYEYCTCSECGYQSGENWMIGSQIKYCQECGCRMNEPQERSGEE